MKTARRYIIFIIWISFLLLYQNIIFTVKNTCQVEHQETLFANRSDYNAIMETYLELDHVNDLVLEYQTREYACSNTYTNISSINCSDLTRANFTFIYFNGEEWKGNSSKNASRIELLNSMVHPTDGPHVVKLREDITAKKIVEKLINATLPPKFRAWGCDEVKGRFKEENLVTKYKKLSDGWSTFKFEMPHVDVWSGTVYHEVIGDVNIFYRKVDTHNNIQEAYDSLLRDLRFREYLGTDTSITERLIGSCVTDHSIEVVTESIQGERLCTENPMTDEEFGLTACAKSTKIKEMILSKSNPSKSGLQFLSNVLLVLQELEKKDLYIEELHGYHFTVTPDLKIHLNNISLLTHHKGHNLYSRQTCVKDMFCNAPIGPLWRNESANMYLYQNCYDIRPTCFGHSCAGFNASLNTCGMAKWVFFPIYSIITDRAVKVHVTNLMTSAISSWPMWRRPAEEMWRKSLLYLEMYEREQEESGIQRAVHVGIQPKIKRNN